VKRKALLVGAALGALVLICALYTAFTVGRHLLGARSALSGSVSRLDTDSIIAAADDLQAASDSFDDLPVQVLRLLPVVRQNLDALEAATTSSVGVVEQARELRTVLDTIETEGAIQDGVVRFDLLQNLRDPLAYEAQSLTELRENVDRHLSGWLLPSVWQQLDDLSERAEDLSTSATQAADLLNRLAPMLGVADERTYLVMVMNNAELRGAGGIPSGLGTITVEDGRLSLGRFHYYRKLSAKPYSRVESPPDYRKRYARYGGDTTLWANTTMDPDVPDTALVAARLFRRSTGIATQGAIVADPRGIASLLEPDAPVSLSADESIDAEDLPDFAYSESYEEIGGESSERRNALVRVGRSAFESLIGDEGSAAGLADAGGAIAGGHLRFVSFDPSEQAALDAVDATGELRSDSSDVALATVQNSGADKLDFHAKRTVEHSCDLTAAGTATCLTKMTLANEAPEGLTDYVAPNEPYGIMESLAEIYVPEDARVTGAFVNGVAADHYQGRQDGLLAVGFDLNILRGREVSVSVSYDLPLGDEPYSLTVLPQPLSKDAEITIGLKVSDEQEVRGPGSAEDGIWTYSGPLEGALGFELEEDARRGFSKLWERAVRFWNGPLF
jgi:hypothetical protein